MNHVFLAKNHLVIHDADVSDDINDQSWAPVRVQVDHVAQRSVRQCREENRDVVLLYAIEDGETRQGRSRAKVRISKDKKRVPAFMLAICYASIVLCFGQLAMNLR